jgi:hypothetical protein
MSSMTAEGAALAALVDEDVSGETPAGHPIGDHARCTDSDGWCSLAVEHAAAGLAQTKGPGRSLSAMLVRLIAA